MRHHGQGAEDYKQLFAAIEAKIKKDLPGWKDWSGTLKAVLMDFSQSMRKGWRLQTGLDIIKGCQVRKKHWVVLFEHV